jgi:hypothetical protein
MNNHHHHHPQQQVLLSSTPTRQKNYRNMHAALPGACLFKGSLDLSVRECFQLLVACTLAMCASIMANRARHDQQQCSVHQGVVRLIRGIRCRWFQRSNTGIRRAH